MYLPVVLVLMATLQGQLFWNSLALLWRQDARGLTVRHIGSNFSFCLLDTFLPKSPSTLPNKEFFFFLRLLFFFLSIMKMHSWIPGRIECSPSICSWEAVQSLHYSRQAWFWVSWGTFRKPQPCTVSLPPGLKQGLKGCCGKRGGKGGGWASFHDLGLKFFPTPYWPQSKRECAFMYPCCKW